MDLVDQPCSEDFVDGSPGGGKGRSLIQGCSHLISQGNSHLRIDMEDAFAVKDKVVPRATERWAEAGHDYDLSVPGKPPMARGATIFQVVDSESRRNRPSTTV